MSSTILLQQKLFGLLELDAEGKVLYSRIEMEDNSRGSSADVTGHDFYSEVASFLNVKEFQQCVDDFNRSSKRASSFVFNCDYADSIVPVRVLLARIRQRTNNNRLQSLLMHIKKIY